MKIIIIIFAGAWIIYKTGVAGRFLKLFRTGAPVPFKSEARHAAMIKNDGRPLIENTAENEIEVEKLNREQLEIQAAYIVKKQGHNPYTVKYMSNDLLEAVIVDYINAVNMQ